MTGRFGRNGAVLVAVVALAASVMSGGPATAITNGTSVSDNWLQLTAEAAEVEQRLPALLAAGAPADGAAARAAAEAHRQHITRWFYDCSSELHRGLAEMYLTDGRFCEHFDRVAPGLAEYVHDAILANTCPTLPVQDARSMAILRLPLLGAHVQQWNGHADEPAG